MGDIVLAIGMAAILMADVVMDAITTAAVRVAAILPDGQGVQILTHRMVDIQAQGQSWQVVLKGDSREQPDLPIPIEWIVGRLEQEMPDK